MADERMTVNSEGQTIADAASLVKKMANYAGFLKDNPSVSAASLLEAKDEIICELHQQIERGDAKLADLRSIMLEMDKVQAQRDAETERLKEQVKAAREALELLSYSGRSAVRTAASTALAKMDKEKP